MQPRSIRDYVFKRRMTGTYPRAQRVLPSSKHTVLFLLFLVATSALIYGASPLFSRTHSSHKGIAYEEKSLVNAIETPLAIPAQDSLSSVEESLIEEKFSLEEDLLLSSEAPLSPSISHETPDSIAALATVEPFSHEDELFSSHSILSAETWVPVLLSETLPNPSLSALWNEQIIPLSLEALFSPETLVDSSLPQVTQRLVTIAKGDSLSAIFTREKLPQSELMKLLKTKHASHLKNLRPGQEIELQHVVAADSELNTLQYMKLALNAQRKVVIEPDDSGAFASRLIETPLERHIVRATGKVSHSLASSMTEAGIPNRMAVELEQIFGSVIDFNRDVRSGDRYTIVYESLIQDGKEAGAGKVLAAEYNNRGTLYRAVRFENTLGEVSYYTPEGNSLKPAFTRYPVKFTRISSHFSRARKHPVLGMRRPHLGVDFAAPTGTPIIASGDGQVAQIGNRGGYGRTIVLNHGSQYRSLYAHMSRYAPGLKKGDRVRHGQVIGYVGSSGVATGPHLHYEFHVNGVHHDPLKVALPGSAPLDQSQLAQFNQQSRTLLAMLDQDSDTLVAMSDLEERPETLRQQ